MAVILPEQSAPSTPASTKHSVYVPTTGTPLPRVARVDSAGTTWYSSDIFMTSLSADYSLSDVNTAQKAFNSSTNGAITLPASSSYLLEFSYVITNTGTTSHTWGVLFGGTATLTSGILAVHGRSGITSAATLTADTSAYTTDLTTVLVCTAASTSSTEHVILSGQGIVRINGAGTFIPQVKMSAAANGGGASTEKMLANSWLRLTPFGTNTAVTLGNWS